MAPAFSDVVMVVLSVKTVLRRKYDKILFRTDDVQQLIIGEHDRAIPQASGEKTWLLKSIF